MDNLDLDALMEAVPVHQKQTARVDISKFFNRPEGETVLTFQEPDVSSFVRAGKDGEVLCKRNPLWPAEQGSSVAILAICHVEPVGKTPRAFFYEKIALTNSPLFLHIQAAFSRAYPHLQDLQKAAEEEKNASGGAESIFSTASA